MLKLLTTVAAGALLATSFAMAGPDIGVTDGVNAGGTVGGTVGTPSTGATGNVNTGTSVGGSVDTGTSAGADVDTPNAGASASGSAGAGASADVDTPDAPNAKLNCMQATSASAASAGRFHAMIVNNTQTTIAANKTIKYTLSDGTEGSVKLQRALPPGGSIETSESASAGFSCNASVQ